VVGRASALLALRHNPRVVAFAVLAAALGTYYAVVEHLWNFSLWWDVAWIGFVLFPAVFALVWLALPLWRAKSGLLAVAIAFGVAAAALQIAGLDVLANFAKLGGITLFGFWFLAFFESVSWVVLVAAIIPFVDGYSVWRGPTRHIVHEQRELFTTLSFAFPVPGEHGSANLGLPDLLFFAVFLAASDRFLLRPWLTWILMVASFGATTALAVAFDVGGLPALPLLSLAFVVANADLLLAYFRRWRVRERRLSHDES
jgi:hypothetical protein